MAKRKFVFKRRKPQTIQEMCWNVIGIERPRKRGKYSKMAILMIYYGSGNKVVQTSTGLSLRRIKVIRKEILNKTCTHLQLLKKIKDRLYAINTKTL